MYMYMYMYMSMCMHYTCSINTLQATYVQWLVAPISP